MKNLLIALLVCFTLTCFGQAPKYVGKFFGDGSALQSPIAALMSSTVTNSRSTGRYGSATVTNSLYQLISAPGTRGVVRSLVIMGDVGVTGRLDTNLAKVNLMVWCDSNLTVNVNLANLSGVRYLNASNAWAYKLQGLWLNSISDSEPELAPGQYLYWYELRFPMPFTNGCYAKLTNIVAGTNWAHGYIGATVTDGLVDGLAEYRLYGVETNKALAAVTSNFLFSATGSGQVLGFMGGLSNSVGSDVIQWPADAGIVWRLNGNYSWEPIGLDDFFGNTWGSALGPIEGAFYNGRSGTPTFSYNSPSTPAYFTAYRWLYEDAITFTNGIIVATSADRPTMEASSWTMFYLRKP